jgi:hypothetical protein
MISGLLASLVTEWGRFAALQNRKIAFAGAFARGKKANLGN